MALQIAGRSHAASPSLRLLELPWLALKPSPRLAKPRHIAVIDPARCIGCTLCIVACPVDAIVGAPKAMHQVINAACTGCDLCLPPCPVDCIEMVRVDGLLDWTLDDAAVARAAHEARNARLQKEYSDSQAIAAASPVQVVPASVDAASKQAAIADALAKARARRARI